MEKNENKQKKENLAKQIDWVSTLVPLAGVLALCALFMILPGQSTIVLQAIRGFLGDDCGLYYSILGLGIFGCTMYIAFSKYGKIKLGNLEKPQYSSFKWGTMIFTSTMAADILFYSLCEWALYANESHIADMGGIQKWASTYPLFHWGPIAWGFYIVLAVAFGFMLHVRGRDKQKFSEACRPVLGKKVDGFWGKVIDLIAVFALLAGTFTSFIILGNYGMAQQLKHGVDISGFIADGGDYSQAILMIFDTLPLAKLGLILLVITMIAFYSTTFDALTMVVSSYSYKRLDVDKEPDKKVRTFWAVLFILLPIALIFAENSMYSLQSVSIIAAFPIGFIILLIVISFFKDANAYFKERAGKTEPTVSGEVIQNASECPASDTEEE